MERKQHRILNDVVAGKAGTLVLRPHQMETATAHGNLSNGAIDLSAGLERTVVIHAPPPRRLEDIAMRNGPVAENISRAPEIFLQIDERKYRRRDIGAELARMAGVGMLILALFHSINIYHHGLLLKNSVVASASEGYQNLLSGGQKVQSGGFDAAAFRTAENEFQQASAHFNEALQFTRFLNANQNLLLSREKTVQSVQAILSAGKVLAEAGTDFIGVLKKLQDLPALMLEPVSRVENLESKFAQETNGNQQSGNRPSIQNSLTEILKKDLEVLNQAQSKLEVAADYFSLIDKNILPLDYQSKFTAGQQKLLQLLQIVSSAQQKIPVFLKLLGDRYPHRYLILLQNDTEARPTGGFIGSYLIVDFNDGRLETMEFHDVYELDGQLRQDIPSPEDIARISKNWRMRDANYSPDFAISGGKAAWFLQKEGGPSVDTVIAINQSFLANLFDVTGPITLDGLPVPLTKDTYQTVLSYIVESKLSGDQDPKKILRGFIPAFQKKLFSGTSLPRTIKILLKGLDNKNIQFYSRDEEIEQFFTQMGFGGKVFSIQPGEDYLDVVSTSIGGNKSDLYIRQNITHTSEIDSDGTVTDQLNITRAHIWNQDAAGRIQATLKNFGFGSMTSGIQSILGAGKNKAVLKVYVPLGSTLTGASMAGQNIPLDHIAVREDKDLQKTFFMFEMDVDAGQLQTVTLNYRLPQKLKLDLADSYKLFVQKQAGLVISDFRKNIVLKPGISFYAHYPEFLSIENAASSSTQNTGSGMVGPSMPRNQAETQDSTPQRRPAWIEQNQTAIFEQKLERDFHVAVLVGR